MSRFKYQKQTFTNSVSFTLKNRPCCLSGVYSAVEICLLKCCAVAWGNVNLFCGFHQCEIKVNPPSTATKTRYAGVLTPRTRE